MMNINEGTRGYYGAPSIFEVLEDGPSSEVGRNQIIPKVEEMSNLFPASFAVKFPHINNVACVFGKRKDSCATSAGVRIPGE